MQCNVEMACMEIYRQQRCLESQPLPEGPAGPQSGLPEAQSATAPQSLCPGPEIRDCDSQISKNT